MLPPQMFDKFGVTKKPGEIIFCEYEPGDSLFFIQEGSVRVSKIVKDTEKTLDILTSGDIFGEMAILEAAPRSATVIAETEVRLLKFNKQSFEALVNAQPALAIRLLKIFANRIYDQKRKLLILNLPDNETRVMDVFLMLAEKKNIHTDTAREMIFETDPVDIANWSGMKTEECRRVLASLEKNSKIQIQPRQIKVANLSEFKRFVTTKRHLLDRSLQ